MGQAAIGMDGLFGSVWVVLALHVVLVQ